MEIFEQRLNFLKPLNTNPQVHRSILEMSTVKIENTSLSISAAERLGVPNLSSPYDYDCINKLGNMFINKKTSLQDFFYDIKVNTSIVDGTYLKREGKEVYGAKKSKTMSMRSMSYQRIFY